MTKARLAHDLNETCLFTINEVNQILQAIGTYDIKFVPPVCELLGIATLTPAETNWIYDVHEELTLEGYAA